MGLRFMTRIVGIVIISAVLSWRTVAVAKSAQPAPSAADAAIYEGSFDGASEQLSVGRVKNGMAKIAIDSGGAGCGASVSGEAAVLMSAVVEAAVQSSVNDDPRIEAQPL